MAADTTTSATPDFRFLVSHPAHFIALGFGSGLVPFAPGTFGTLVGWALFALLAMVLPAWAIAGVAIALLVLGIWACDVTGRHLGVQDHGAIVWDEVVAFMALLAYAEPALVAFIAFRVFDIWKPPPIRQLERAVKGGAGVMADDLAAAAYAAIAVTLYHFAIP